MLSRRELFKKTATIAKGAALTDLAGVVASCSDSGAKEPVHREPTFDIELDGLRGVFYSGGGNKYFSPDILEVYQDGQLKWKMFDTGDTIIGNMTGLGHDKDALEEYENGKVVGRYEQLKTYHRGAGADAWSHGQTSDMLRDLGRQKLKDATALYQKFLKTGLSR